MPKTQAANMNMLVDIFFAVEPTELFVGAIFRALVYYVEISKIYAAGLCSMRLLLSRESTTAYRIVVSDELEYIR
jgi:hypothetical protein